MSFNVHTLKHVMTFVKNFGSLWAWSAFPFESYNSVIKKLFHGTQCIPDQMCKSYLRLRLIKNKSEVFNRDGCSEIGKNLFIKMMNSCKVKNCIKYNDDLKFYSLKDYIFTDLEENLVNIYLEDDVAKVEQCERFIYKKTLWHTLNFNRLQRRINSCVITTDRRIFLINRMFKVKCNDSDIEKKVLLGFKINILEEEYLCKVENLSSSSFMFIGKKTDDIDVIDVSLIEKKCVYMEMENNKVCIVPVVNNLETD